MTAVIGFMATACGGGGSGSQCSGDKVPYSGQCVKKCENDLECASGNCVGTNQDYNICKPGDDDNGGMDAGMDTGGGGGDEDTGGGGGGDDTGTPGGDDTGTPGGDDTGGGGSCTNPGNLTCGGVYSCLSQNNCGEADNQSQCIQNCVDKGNCAARTQFDALMNCQQEKCAGPNASSTCTLDKCTQAYKDCGLVGSLSCSQSLICSTKCERQVIDNATRQDTQQDLQRKYSKCVSDKCGRGTIQAQKDQAAIGACVRGDNENNKDCTASDASATCQWDNCSQEYQSCGVLGSKTCTGIDQCIAGCSMGDYECEAECIWKGKADARAQRSDIRSCQSQCQQNNSETDAIIDCIYTGKCKSKREACGKVGSTHTQCPDLTGCLGQCNDGDAKCQNTCIWKANASTQATFIKATVCFRQQRQRGSTCANQCSGSNNQEQCLIDCINNECPNVSTCELLQQGG